MNRIQVRPESLVQAGHKFQMASSEIRGLEQRLQSVVRSVDWNSRAGTGMDSRVAQAGAHARGLAEQMETLAAGLLRSAESFRTMDERGEHSVGKIDLFARNFLSTFLPALATVGGLPRALSAIERIVRMGFFLGNTTFLQVATNLRWLFAGRQEEMNQALVAAKIAYYRARERGDRKGMEAAHQQANFLRALGATISEAESARIDRQYGGGGVQPAEAETPHQPPAERAQQRAGAPGVPLPTTNEAARKFNVFQPSGLTGEQLNQMLEGTSLANLGASYAQAEAAHSVNAVFMIAKDLHEVGRTVPSDIFEKRKNTGGYFRENEFMTFQNHHESIMFGAELLTRDIYKGAGRDTIPEIQAKYAPENVANDPKGLNSHWQSGVTSLMAEFGQKANAILAGAADAAPTVEAPPSPPVPSETAADDHSHHSHGEEASHTHAHHPGAGHLPEGEPDTVTSGFETKEPWRLKPHTGLDLVPAFGGTEAEVYPYAEGKVLHVGWNSAVKYGEHGGYGYYVDIQHPDGTITRYAHLKEGSVMVEKDQEVRADQPIGELGHTGHSRYWDPAKGTDVPVVGPEDNQANHLHFEVIKGGKAVDPAPYLEERGRPLLAPKGGK